MFANCLSLGNIKFSGDFGKQTGTASAALLLDLSTCNANNNYQLTDNTYATMLTMHDRATAGLTPMTIQMSSNHNVPDGWEDKMTARGYTITKV